MSFFSLGIGCSRKLWQKPIGKNGVAFYKLQSEDAVGTYCISPEKVAGLWEMSWIEAIRSPVSCTDLRPVAQVFCLQPCLLHGPWTYVIPLSLGLSLAQSAAFSYWTFQMNPGPHLVLDCVWSAPHWWRNLLLSPHGPAQVLRDCVLVSERTALTLSSWVAHLHRAALVLLPRATTIHQIHMWGIEIWRHG